MIKKILNSKCPTQYSNPCREELAALGRRMPWANRLFSKSMKGKILNFLHEKIRFPFFKKNTLLLRDKSKFFFQIFSLLKLAKMNFHF